MKHMTEVEHALTVEALSQCVALLEMAIESDTLMGCYEPVRVTTQKLIAVGMGLAHLIPFLIDNGEVSMDEMEEESQRVREMIHQYVKMRIEFRKGEL